VNATFTVTLEARVDEFRRSWWTRIPYRHVQLDITMRSVVALPNESVIREFLVPAVALDNFSNLGGDWNSSYDTMIDGVDYFVWA
jgi:hypothetical protein